MVSIVRKGVEFHSTETLKYPLEPWFGGQKYPFKKPFSVAKLSPGI
jgi:hypothetical protein